MTSEETRKAAERLVKASKCTTLESLHELYGHHPLAFDSIEKTRDAIDRDKEITSGAYLDRLADDEHRDPGVELAEHLHPAQDAEQGGEDQD